MCRLRPYLPVARVGTAILAACLAATTAFADPPSADVKPADKALAMLAPPAPDRHATPDSMPREPRWSFRFSFGDCRDGPGGRTALGGLIGGLAGGLLGAHLAEEGDEPAAAAAGALVGGLVGGTIGRAVELSDPACRDGTRPTVPTGQPVLWTDPATGI